MYSLRSSTDFWWRRKLRLAQERREVVLADERIAIDEAIARSPGDIVPLIIKAMFLDAFDMHAEATDAFEAVARLAPDQWFWLALQARSALKAGQGAAAHATQQRARSMAPHEPMLQSSAPVFAARPGETAVWTADRALRASRLASLNLAGVQADELDLSLSQIDDGNFVLASLRRAKLRRVWIQRSSFTGANLAGADLSESFLLYYPDVGMRGEGIVNFDRANLSGARLSKTHTFMASFAGTDLTDVEAHDAVLERALFSRARLVRADLSRAKLSYAQFERSSLDEARLVGANLEGAVIERSSLRNASFDGANLKKATLDVTQADGASFKGAIYDCDTQVLRRPKGEFAQGESVSPESLGMIPAGRRCDGRN
jgi:uncharacterized protein YjbI with pentapeptide repeats